MISTADTSNAASHDQSSSLPRFLRLGALAITAFGLIEDPFVRLLILLAAGVLALQAFAMAICTTAVRPAGTTGRNGQRCLEGGWPSASGGERIDMGPNWK